LGRGAVDEFGETRPGVRRSMDQGHGDLEDLTTGDGDGRTSIFVVVGATT
jgi:hypothetical protein